MQWVPIIGLLTIVAAIGLFLILRSRTPSQSIEDRLDEISASGQSITLEALELSQPFSQRVLVPMVEKLSHIAQRFTPSNTIEETRHKLELAGIAHKLKPAQFLGIRVLGALVLGAVSLLIVFAGTLPILQRLLVIVVAFVLGFLFPSIWLGSKIKRRQNDVLKSLPDAMDLLTICVEAGLDFSSAMQRVAEKWSNELSQAFLRTVQEMQLGK
ncbi:MAG: type II secretion system F family protein, partial [Anaerolineales bacterium]